MKKTGFQIPHKNGLMRQNSEVNLDKDRNTAKQERQMRQMKSVNKVIGLNKKQFFFDQGQKTIGHYKFDTRKQIGSGYSSKVYKAISNKNNQFYAVKAIELKNFKSSHFTMLQNEIQILKRMDHPNIIKFENVYKTATHLYIVTEFCEKGDLLTHMTRKGNLPEMQALKIFADIVEGLQYLFKEGILHRDIKPGNIISNGKKWKIADFGFAMDSAQQVKTKNNVGTPLYMPLQALQKNIYSAQSDIFAAGIVLYEMILGVTPWQCRSQQELLAKLQKIPFRISSKAKISEEVRLLLKKLCQNDKNTRMNKQQFLQLSIDGIINMVRRPSVFRQPHQEISQIKLMPAAKYGAKSIEERSIIKQVDRTKPKNEVNLVTTGKLKRSVQNERKPQQPVPSLIKIKSQSNLLVAQSSTLNQDDSPSKHHVLVMNKQKLEKSNRNIMLFLLNFCRFMYYLMKNANYLDLNEASRQKIKVILFRHALAIIKQLSDTEHNWFDLHGWTQYKSTKSYNKMLSSFNQYLAKYEKQFILLTKKIQGSLVRDIYQKLPQFSMVQVVPLNQQFYQKLLSVLAPILRENNHNLASEICGGKKSPTEETLLKIYGIKQLFRYYQLVKQLSKQNLDYQQFQSQTNIEVIKNYSESKTSVQEFMELRKQMKYI